jgi:hypothetical protein
MGEHTRPGAEKTGHGDSPRQDSQRPSHEDRGDAGGQESRNERQPETHAEIPAVPSTPRGLHTSEQGSRPEARQAQRPGQPGRSIPGGPGERDAATLGSRDEPGFGSEPPRQGSRGDEEPGP